MKLFQQKMTMHHFNGLLHERLQDIPQEGDMLVSGFM